MCHAMRSDEPKSMNRLSRWTDYFRCSAKDKLMIVFHADNWLSILGLCVLPSVLWHLVGCQEEHLAYKKLSDKVVAWLTYLIGVTFLFGTRIPQGWQDGKVDGRVNSAVVLSTSYKNLVNYGPLTPEFTWLFGNRLSAKCAKSLKRVHFFETCIRQRIAGTTERICAKFTPKTCLVLRSDEFECQRSRSPGTKNALCTHNTPLCARSVMPLLQIMSRKQQARRFDHCIGVSGMLALGLAGYCYCHAFLVD